MYSELLMGALVAIASPQDRDIKTDRVEIREPATIEIEIEIPEMHFDVGYWSDDDDWDTQHMDTDTDTVFEVNPKAVLAVRNHAGDIVIRTWDRNQVRVEASHSSHDRVKILQSESSVKIKSETRHGLPDVVDYEITIPRTMAVDLWGFQTDISVDGVRNGVRVETMSGDIDLRDVEGELSLRSVEGDITLVRGKGSFEVNCVEGEISVIEFEGDVHVESIDGDISLEGINSDRVEAKTIDGDVRYQGSINDNGRYRLTTHDGDVIIAVPANANATISVATFDGEFEADFPVQLEGAQASRKFNITIGNGSARVELHSFDGDIRLVRQ
jgi:DUF4097 and DUF4098 domain-containing protein YvlB